MSGRESPNCFCQFGPQIIVESRYSKMPTAVAKKLLVVIILGSFQLILVPCPVIKRIKLPQNGGLLLSFCVFKCFSKQCFVVSVI